MNKFAFVIHPLDYRDVARKYPFARHLPAWVVENAIRLLPPVVCSHITGVKSQYAEAEGWFIALPLTTRQMLSLPESYVIKRIIGVGKVAERLGAQILGLGAFTSVIGDAGITIARNLKIPVTTGNTYTVATALEGTREAAKVMGIDISCAEVAVVGATGSIGSACARLLARDVSRLTLIGRSREKLDALARRIVQETGLAPRITEDLKSGLLSADVIITVSSSADAIIEPEFLKPGAVVCDVARPRDVSKRVAEVRNDVLVIEGGVIEVPGDVKFNFDFGFPDKMAMACMAETMILALEGRFEDFTLGRDITVEKIEEISSLAKKHGFRLAGFRSFERALSREAIDNIRRNAASALDKWHPAAV